MPVETPVAPAQAHVVPTTAEAGFTPATARLAVGAASLTLVTLAGYLLTRSRKFRLF
ncbi:MAG: hypothetical protein ABIR26_09150 [Ramlibacter sp.]